MLLADDPIQEDVRRSRPIARRFLTAFAVLLAIGAAHRYLLVQKLYYHGFRGTYAQEGDAKGVRDLVTRFDWEIAGGVAHDMAFALVFGLGLAILPRFALWIAVGVLGFFYAANLDHVEANLASIDLAFLGLGMSETFISAHLTRDFVEKVVAFWIVGAVVGLVCLWRPIRLASGAAAVSSVAFAAVALPPGYQIDAPPALQTHPLLPVLNRGPLDVETRSFDEAAFRSQLAPLVGDKRYNLLIVFLEGFSRHSLEKGELSVLSSLAEENLDLTRMFGHQIVTANGLHTTLYGQVPRMIERGFRWYEPLDPGYVGLPRRLSELGYHTAFLQSAPLGYMDKDVHLRDIGYDDLLGMDEWTIPEGASVNGWGLDDVALFQNILAYIDAQPAERPWHISALTTSTHMPYNVPDGFLPEVDSLRLRALKWADRGVETLMDGLAARGMLENTVVVLTSDESRETSAREGLDNDILLNWLPMIVVHPDGAPREIEAAYMNSDVPVLALELATGGAEAIVRLERGTDRPLVFGNRMMRRVYWYEPESDVFLACHAANDVACERRSGVADPTRPSLGVSEGIARYPALKALIDHYDD